LAVARRETQAVEVPEGIYLVLTFRNVSGREDIYEQGMRRVPPLGYRDWYVKFEHCTLRLYFGLGKRPLVDSNLKTLSPLFQVTLVADRRVDGVLAVAIKTNLLRMAQ
jgi:hypothetical protein